jgi:hypothetical protein
MTVKIDSKAGDAPQALVEKLVDGQTFPFVLELKHKHIKALVVPSSGINTPIAPGEAVKVRVRSIDQAWLLVTDLSQLASRAGSDAEDFAELTAPQVVAPVPEAPLDPVGDTPADSTAGKSTAKVTKPGKTEAAAPAAAPVEAQQ